jgi:uncharacterized protein (DUF1330 family)
MPAYIIAFIEVTNPEKYAQYTQRTPAAIAKFGGKFIVRGGKTLTLEGPRENRRVVVIEFPDFARAELFYRSQEYQQAKVFRDGAAKASFIVVDGHSPPAQSK